MTANTWHEAKVVIGPTVAGQPEGVELVRREDGAAVYRTGSGHYSFAADWAD